MNENYCIISLQLHTGQKGAAKIHLLPSTVVLLQGCVLTIRGEFTVNVCEVSCYSRKHQIVIACVRKYK